MMSYNAQKSSDLMVDIPVSISYAITPNGLVKAWSKT